MSSREDAHKAKSVREFMDRENIKSLGVNDLKKVTDVPCYISKNAANALTFIVNIVLSICYGYYGVGGSQTYEQISQKYQSLVTPIYWTQAIWIPIAILELIFVVIQLIHPFCDLNLVQYGVSWWFSLVQLSQMAFIIFYCWDILIPAVISLVLTAILLCFLCYSIYYFNTTPLKEPTPNDPDEERDDDSENPNTYTATTQNRNIDYNIDPFMDYMILRAPFHLHLGWVIFLAYVHFCDITVRWDWGSKAFWAYIMILLIWAVGIALLFYPKNPNFMTVFALGWGSMGIWIALNNPTASVVIRFGMNNVRKIRGGAIASSIESLVLGIMLLGYQINKKYSIVTKTN